MDNLCTNGMFACAFEFVAGIGLALVFVIFVAACLGISFGKED